MPQPKAGTGNSGVGGSEGNPPTTPYSMHEAAVDLLTYYWAGTVPHALVSMQQLAGAQAINCKTRVNNIKTGNPGGTAIESDLSTTPAPTPVSPGQPKAC